MTTKVLVVQGGGQGAYAEDQALAEYLRSALGKPFEVIYPEFPGLESVDFHAWQPQAISAMEELGEDAIVVAHSLCGPALLKVLSDTDSVGSIRALYLVAMPYKCTDGEWGTDDFALASDFADSLVKIEHLVLYHSRDDEWVPFEHLELYAEKLPDAAIVPLEDRGHSFMKRDFIELVDDINSIQLPMPVDRPGCGSAVERAH